MYILTEQDIDNKDITRLYHMDLDFEFVAFIFKSLIVVLNFESIFSYLFFGLLFSCFGCFLCVIVLIHLYIIVPLVQRGIDGG